LKDTIEKYPITKGISHHFRRESKIMVGLFITVIFLGIFAAIVVPRLMFHLEVDRCLDLGGSYNYEAGLCEMGKSE